MLEIVVNDEALQRIKSYPKRASGETCFASRINIHSRSHTEQEVEHDSQSEKFFLEIAESLERIKPFVLGIWQKSCGASEHYTIGIMYPERKDPLATAGDFGIQRTFELLNLIYPQDTNANAEETSPLIKKAMKKLLWSRGNGDRAIIFKTLE